MKMRENIQTLYVSKNVVDAIKERMKGTTASRSFHVNAILNGYCKAREGVTNKREFMLQNSSDDRVRPLVKWEIRIPTELAVKLTQCWFACITATEIGKHHVMKLQICEFPFTQYISMLLSECLKVK